MDLTVEQKALLIATLGVGALSVLSSAPKIVFPTRLFKKWYYKFLKEGGVEFGKTFIRDSDRVRHTHIVGSPGSGKTEATKALIFEDIKRGRGCLIIDAKGDRELYEEVLGCAHAFGRGQDVKLLSANYPLESEKWNPCALGSASELQTKFLNANIYSEPFYAKACEYALGQAFLTLKQTRGFNVADLSQKLSEIASRQKQNPIQGLAYDFGSLIDGEWGPLLLCEQGLNILDVVLKNQILFVDLPTEGKSIQSSRVGRLLTQELILISGMRKTRPELNRSGVFAVYIDEFDAFATESFVTFLNKARSSNFMIHIAHQTLSDLRKVSDTFAGQVLGNCNLHLIFRQDDPDDAELWARFIGTHEVTKKTRQTQNGSKTGAASEREAMEFLIWPDLIKNLGVGECVVSIKTQAYHKKTKLRLPPSYRKQAIVDASASSQNVNLAPGLTLQLSDKLSQTSDSTDLLAKEVTQEDDLKSNFQKNPITTQISDQRWSQILKEKI